ncbi:hypothetical protein E2I00_009490, partial [Balaenoptera physalus]
TPQKYDPTFKGPIYNRGCTDVICCVFLLLAIVGYVAVGIIGEQRRGWDWGSRVEGQATASGAEVGLVLRNGSPSASLDPSTAWTHGDPRKEQTLPVLFQHCEVCQPPGPAGIPICVEKCPDRYLTYLNARRSQDFEYYKKFCVPGFQNNKGRGEVSGAQPDWSYPPLCAVARRCFPAIHSHKGVLMVGNETTYEDGHGSRKNITELVEGAKKANGVLEARQLAMRIFEDYTVSWYWIIIGLAIAMVLSLLFIVLLRFLAGIMVWVMIVMVILVLGYGIFHCYMEYARLRGEAGSDISLVDLGFHTDLRRILIAIALIKEASRWVPGCQGVRLGWSQGCSGLDVCVSTPPRAVGYVMCSLLYPLVTFFLLCLCIAYWASTAMYPLSDPDLRPRGWGLSATLAWSFLSTSNEAVYKIFNDTACSVAGKTCNPETFPSSNESRLCPGAHCQFAFYGGESTYHRALLGLQIFNAFMFFWLANFVLALGQVTLAGAFASYYWALNKPDDLPAFPLFSAFGRALRYHTGSLAFGSLILAIVQIIRVILEYLDQRLKAAENKFAKFLMTCLKCCFWCLEKFIRFLNRNAYIMIAIYGTNFCTSARNAFFLLMRNIIRVAVLDKVTDFLFLLGKLLIVGSVGILAFFFFTHRIRIVQDTAPPLNYYWVPILTVIIGSYLIAHGFFSVYGMCVDTLFLCFLEDLERNDGTAERPYFMSLTLKKLLNKTNKKPVES